MKSFYNAEKISDNVWWVGAVDWSVRNFHGYLTGRGTTYNAFLIIDEKITLIDTVKKPFFDEMMERISTVIDPEKIDYIIHCFTWVSRIGLFSIPKSAFLLHLIKLAGSKGRTKYSGYAGTSCKRCGKRFLSILKFCCKNRS